MQLVLWGTSLRKYRSSRLFDCIESKEAPGYYYVLMMNVITCEATPVSTSNVIRESVDGLTMLKDIITRGQRLGQIREGDPMELAAASFSAVLDLASLKVSWTFSQMPDSEILMQLF